MKRRGFALTLAILLLLSSDVVSPSGVSARPIDPNWSPPSTVLIPETGQTIDRLFLDLWRGGGGTWSFGLPITPETTYGDGRVVQYYEYARFEYWPNGDDAGNLVTLANIGAELRPPAIPRRQGSLGSDKAAETAREATLFDRAWTSLTDSQAAAAVVTEPSYRFVPETGHGVWGGFRDFWEGTGDAAYLGNPLTEEYLLAGTSYQVFERGQLAWRPGAEVWMVPVGNLLADRYRLDRSPINAIEAPVYSEELFIPPLAVPDRSAAPAPPAGFARAIVISLSQQALWAYEGNAIVKSTFVSTGKERFETPPGLFSVNSKTPVQDMAGVLGGEYYNVPKVPDVMYFTDRGHAIHGAYWHDNFGNPMSHGCINLPLDVSAWLYGWAEVGTPVLIVN